MQLTSYAREADAVVELSAAPGDTLVHVRDASSYPLRLDHIRDDDLIVLEDPSRHRFDGPNEYLLPAGRFIALDCVAAIVVAVETSPQLEECGLDGATELVRSVIRTIVDSGWQRDLHDPRIVGDGELRAALNDPNLPDRSHWYVAAFVSRSTRALVRLRRLHRRGIAFNQDLFLVNVQTRDDALGRRLDRIVRLLRAEDGVAVERARRIEADVYLRRVAALLERSTD